MRLVLIIKSRFDGQPTDLPWMALDKIHTDGSVTLAPTRIDGNQYCQIPESRVIGWKLQLWENLWP